jgi:hypothetical protein
MLRILSLKLTLLSILACIICLQPAYAHHSFSAEFSPELGVIEGEVAKVFYRNPHTHFYLKVVTASGEEEEWDAHGQNLRVMMRAGWGIDKVKIGDRVKVEGNLGKDGTKKIAIMKLTKDDGEELMPFPGNRSGFVGALEDSQIKENESKAEQE